MSAVLGVGISIRCDGPEFEDLGPNLDRAEALGVEFVEIPTLAMDLVAGGRVMRERVARAKRLLAGRALRYTVHGPIGINLMDTVERLPLHEAVLRASLDVAAEFGALHYVVHTGISGEGPDLTSVYARQRERLARAGDFARERNLIIVVENVFTKSRTLSAALPSELARELIAIAHPSVKACLDFSHAFIHTTAKGADFLHEAKALAPLAKHLHVHDSFGRRTEILTYSAAERLAFGQGDLHLPVGWGAIPWADLMRECRFADGVVFNIELEQRYQAQAEAVVAATRELVRQAMSVGQA